MRQIYEIFGQDAHAMTIALMESANIAAMIPTGANIALKPNLVVAASPDRGATTHAGVLSGVIEYLQASGQNKISIMEGSWVGDSTQRAFKVCGYDKVSQKYDVPFYDLKEDTVQQVATPAGPISICNRALDTDFLINLPVLKGHCQTRMTCALKNCKGCIPDQEKRHFHSMGLHRPIAALAAALKPELTIVDSICGDLNFEEGGTPIYTNRMILGTDPVQIDAYGCHLMGLDPTDVPYIHLAEEWGAGQASFCNEDIVQVNDPAQGADYPKPSGRVAALTKNVEAASACSACYGNLVRALYQLSQSGSQHFDKIFIGQQFKGQAIDGIGIGSCCSGAIQAVKGCPPTADEIIKLLETL